MPEDPEGTPEPQPPEPKPEEAGPSPGPGFAPLRVPSHGGGKITRILPGHSGNPRGRPPKRLALARELARAAGLEELLTLARKVKRRRGELSDALLASAIDGNPMHRVAAQRLVWQLLGELDNSDAKRVRVDLGVEVRRKVRVMDVEASSETTGAVIEAQAETQPDVRSAARPPAGPVASDADAADRGGLRPDGSDSGNGTDRRDPF